jgi:transposase InsO family protein
MLPVTAIHLMNNGVLPTFEAHGVKIESVLSDNGQEFCGRPDQYPYELFLQLEDIAHRTTRVRRPQSSGILERFHRTLLDEHFRVEGRGMNGRMPIRAFTERTPKTSNTEVTSQTKTTKLKAA